MSFRKRNETAANAIMTAIKNVLKKSGFITHEVAIISGWEEASSAWTSVNYLNQTVRQPLWCHGVGVCVTVCLPAAVLCISLLHLLRSAQVIRPNSWYN